MEAAEYVQGLRDLADWLERHPDRIETLSPVTLHSFTIYEPDTLAELGGWAKALAPCDKADDDNYLMVRRYFGPHRIEVSANKTQTCERVVVGVEKIPERVVPARTEEIVEWRCPDSFLAGR